MGSHPLFVYFFRTNDNLFFFLNWNTHHTFLGFLSFFLLLFSTLGTEYQIQNQNFQSLQSNPRFNLLKLLGSLL